MSITVNETSTTDLAAYVVHGVGNVEFLDEVASILDRYADQERLDPVSICVLFAYDEHRYLEEELKDEQIEPPFVDFIEFDMAADFATRAAYAIDCE